MDPALVIPVGRAIWSCFRVLVPILVLAALLAGWNWITEPCGKFDLNSKEILDTSDVNGWRMDLDFEFIPSECDNTCTCDLTAFVQIVRSQNHEDGTYLYPTGEKKDRATATGFYLDRLGGRIWGYYGRNDDGSFADYVTTGSDKSTANLGDFPRRAESKPWLNFTWMAITVPVCIDNPGSTCNDHLLGYYEWAWSVDDVGTVPYTIHFISPPVYKDDFDDAVDQWNLQATGLGKNKFPTFTRLSQ